MKPHLTLRLSSSAPIPFSASAEVVEKALNTLWSIKPDKVQVTKQDYSQRYEYTVTFNSERGKKRQKNTPGREEDWCLQLIMFVFLTAGDFKPLRYEVFGSDTNVSVAEVTEGRSNMATFTLLWGGVPTKPIAYNATEVQVCHKKTSCNCKSHYSQFDKALQEIQNPPILQTL